MFHHPEIRQRDDGMFDVVNGSTIAGPFETIGFAMQIAEGGAPEPKPTPKFRGRLKIKGVSYASA